MFHLSGFLVLIALLFLSYYFIKRGMNLKKEEVDEKITEVGEIEELHKKAKKVNVDEVLEKKSQIDNLKKI